METKINEIAHGVYRLSTFIPQVPPTRPRLQPIPDPGRGAAALPHRHARTLPAGARRRRQADAGREAALDQVRPLRSRRVRLDERLARHRAKRANRARHDRRAWFRSTTWPIARRACSRTTKSSISAASARAISIRRTCRTAGKRGFIYEETTGTLLCGDLFTQYGECDATTESDIVGPAIAGEDIAGYSALNPAMGATCCASSRS